MCLKHEETLLERSVSFLMPLGFELGDLAQALIKAGYGSSRASDTVLGKTGENLDTLAKQHLGYSGPPTKRTTSGFQAAIGSDTSSPTDYATLAAQQLKLRQEANQPAIKSLEASIPEQAQKFTTERGRLQGEVDPIKQRYQLVLDELKRRETKDTGEVNTALAREFGRRGIPLSSGLYEQTGIEKRQPISEFYGIQGREASASQEESLRNITNLVNALTPQETEATRTIRNAIANLQAGAGNASIDDAFNQLRFQEEQRQFNQNYALQQAQEDSNRKLREAQATNYLRPETKTTDISKNFTALGEGQTLFNLLTGKPIYTANKTYKPTGSGTGANSGW